MRVQKVPILLNWILNGQDGFDANRIDDLAQSLERLDIKLAVPPQLRVAYLTAWPTSYGIVAFRGDVYGLDGTGFVVGQPLPVGEKSDTGQRFVLKPVPRQPAAIDEAEADGFFWFGRRSGGKYDTADERRTKLGEKKAKTTSLFSRSGDDSQVARKKVVKKIAETPKKKATVADAKKTSIKPATKVASANPKKVVKPDTAAAKKAGDICKPDKDGKMPKDCKVAVVEKPKPKAKPDETVSATN